MPDGGVRTWAVVSGQPACLAEIDPITGEVLDTYPLDGAGGAWGVEIAADGTVWSPATDTATSTTCLTRHPRW